jgi:hypothetical protein
LTTSHLELGGEAIIWDIATMKSIPLSRPVDAQLFSRQYSGAWSPDDSKVVTTGCRETGYSTLNCLRGEAWVWDAATGEQLLTLPGYSDWVEAQWTDAGTGILTSTLDGTRRKWTLAGIPELPAITAREASGKTASASDSETCEQTQYLRNAEMWLPYVGVGDGFPLRRICVDTRSWLISASQALLIDDQAHTVLTHILKPAHDAQLHIDATGAKHMAIAGCERNMEAATTSVIFCRQNSGFVEIRDADSGDLLSRSVGLGDNVELVSWSPDGQGLLAFSYYGREFSGPTTLPTLRMLDVPTGEALFAITDLLHTPERIAWSKDGTIIMAFHGSMVDQFFVQMRDLVRSACLQVPRNLTQAEWQRYLPYEPYRPTCPDLSAGE